LFGGGIGGEFPFIRFSHLTSHIIPIIGDIVDSIISQFFSHNEDEEGGMDNKQSGDIR